MAYDVAELSALRWLIDEFGAQHVDLVTENQELKQIVNNQRKALRRLLARQQPGAPSDSELEAIVDGGVTTPCAAPSADALTQPLQEMPKRGGDQN